MTREEATKLLDIWKNLSSARDALANQHAALEKMFPSDKPEYGHREILLQVLWNSGVGKVDEIYADLFRLLDKAGHSDLLVVSESVQAQGHRR